jgi:DNA-binding NarL/FixJ family response regulator
MKHILRILLADDCAPWATYVTSKLGEDPSLHLVGLASDGLEVVLKATELQPDLILMDINVPQMSGIEAARMICELPAPPKILFMSQDLDPDVVRAAFRAGGIGYLAKLDAERELFAAVEAVMSGKRFVSDQLPICLSTDFMDA